MLFQTSEFAWLFFFCAVLYFGRAPGWRWLLTLPTLWLIFEAGQFTLLLFALIAFSSDALLTSRLRRKRNAEFSDWPLLCLTGVLLGWYAYQCIENAFFMPEALVQWSGSLNENFITWIVRNFNVLYLFFALAHNIQLCVDSTHERKHYGWIVLLPISYMFYMAWNPWYAVLIIYSTVNDYVIALCMESAQKQGRRILLRWLLVISLITNLGLLFFFKYYNFFADTVDLAQTSFHVPLHHWLLPVGISFYTFQSLAYTIEVYRGDQPAERNLGLFATYIIFFPQLVAGPIERPQNLLPQLECGPARFWDYSRITNGMKLFVYGLFLKLVLADNLANLVDPVYAAPERHMALIAVATIGFAFQIFGDFAGYTCMALGSSQILGIQLMRNFYAPYRARTIQEFWQRWHISLSTWFRDYVYRPMLDRFGKSKVSMIGAASAVFLLSGLWHGASWNFVIWGVLHLSYYVSERLLLPHIGPPVNAAGLRLYTIFDRLIAGLGIARCLQLFPGRLQSFLQTLCSYRSLKNTAMRLFTFALVCFAWMFFRAGSADTVTSEALRDVMAFPASDGEASANAAASSLQKALTIVSLSPVGLFTMLDPQSLEVELAAIQWYWSDTLTMLWALAVVWAVHQAREQKERVSADGRVLIYGSARAWLAEKPFMVRHAAYYLLAISVLILGDFERRAFIYFQF